VKTSN